MVVFSWVQVRRDQLLSQPHNGHIFVRSVDAKTFQISLVVTAFAFAGCVPAKMSESNTQSTSDQRTYMEQQAKFEQLRSEMAPIVRQISVVLPLDCNTALAKFQMYKHGKP